MSYIDTLREIDQLKAEIAAHGILPQDVLNKINYKFRLEWNYTSNSMEGNSLTRRETRTLMVGLVDVDDKPIKDVMEMRKHDTVISTILKIGAGALNISETRIREIHQGIMYEEEPEKLKLIGVWKNADNFVYNARNERFDFTPHEEVKENIHELINWLNAEKEKIERGTKTALHPAILAFEFHVRYLRIHPFYDGNGRTARILSNLILIAFGFPPVYIREEEKAAYYQYLTDIQGYGGQPDLFYDFMAKLLLRSLRIVKDALQGKDLEEPNDIDKEIALLKKQQIPVIPKIKRSREVIQYTLLHVFYPLLQALDTQFKKFDSLFQSGSWEYFDNVDTPGGQSAVFPVSGSLQGMTAYFDRQNISGSSYDFTASYWLSDYKDQDNTFSIEIAIFIHFGEEFYRMESFLGTPFESSFKKIMNTIQQTPAEAYLSVEGSKQLPLLEEAYNKVGLKHSAVENLANLLSKELLTLIKHRANREK